MHLLLRKSNSILLTTVILLCVFFIFLSAFTFAQAQDIKLRTASRTIEEVTPDGFHILVAYQTHPPVNNHPVSFFFTLTDEKKKPVPDVTEVAITIKDKDRVVHFIKLSGSVSLEGSASVFTFAAPGDYAMTVQFRKDKLVLGETAIPISVGEKVLEAVGPSFYLSITFGALAGAVLLLITQTYLSYFRSRKEDKRGNS